MSTTTIPDPIREREAITPEILSRLNFIHRLCYRHAHACARARMGNQRRELEQAMRTVDELRELVVALDKLPELLDAEAKKRRQVEDAKIQKDLAWSEETATAEKRKEEVAKAKADAAEPEEASNGG